VAPPPRVTAHVDGATPLERGTLIKDEEGDAHEDEDGDTRVSLQVRAGANASDFVRGGGGGGPTDAQVSSARRRLRMHVDQLVKGAGDLLWLAADGLGMEIMGDNPDGLPPVKGSGRSANQDTNGSRERGNAVHQPGSARSLALALLAAVAPGASPHASSSAFPGRPPRLSSDGQAGDGP